jgi:hypothetical protein
MNLGDFFTKISIFDLSKNQGFFMSITWHFMSTDDHPSANNVSLHTIFVILLILHNYCTCWTIIYRYISMYWTIYLLCDRCIVYYSFVPNIITNIQQMPHQFFLSIFHLSPTFPRLRFCRKTGQTSRFQFFKFWNFCRKNHCRTENRPASQSDRFSVCTNSKI